MKTSARTYYVTFAAVGVAAILRWLLMPILKNEAPFSTFTIAVIFATWYGGSRSAILATVVGFVVGLTVFILPHSPVFEDVIPTVARFGMYFIVCFSIAAFGEAMRVAQNRSLLAEQLAMRQAETLRTTFASIGDAVITTNVDGNITYMNAVAEELTGWTLQSAKDNRLTNVFNVTNEPMGQPFQNSTESSSTSKTPVGLFSNTVLVSQHGKKRIIDDSTSTIRDNKGRVAGKVVIFRDISARRQIEAVREEAQHQVVVTLELLRRSEARVAQELADMTRLQELVARLLVCPNLETALDEVLDATIALLSADKGHIQLFNPEDGTLEIVAQRGFEKEFLDYFQTVRRSDNTASGRALVAGSRVMIEDVQSEPTYEPHRKIAASAGYRSIQATPLLDRTGTPLGMLSTHYGQPHQSTERELRFLDLYARQAADFIERTRNEMALRESEGRYRAIGESLRETDRRKDEFLATLAHELRNPLAPMRNAIQLLHTNASEASVLDSARDVIDRQIQQMTRLIDDLLDVSRISRNKLELRKERVDLRNVIESALEASRPLIEEFNHRLSIVLPDEPLELDADLTRLAQVFLNLLNNAAKYTERGGHIELRAWRQGSDVAVSVSDSGIGIPANKLPTLFQMFSQVEDSISRSRGGLGIGLSLVKRLVEMHGGTIDVRSEGLGKGSTFTVSLPLVLVSSQATDTTSSFDRTASVSKLRILVVDDNIDAANTLTMILQLMGNQVQTVHDGEAAVETASEFRPDVILLDIGLPKMNGYDVARCVRKQAWGQQAVLIAVTGWGQDSDKRQAMEAGFDKHLVKPVNPQVLLKILAGIQESKREEALTLQTG